MDALARLAELPDTWVAIDSGRSLADLHLLARAPAGALLAGGHGSELDPADLLDRTTPDLGLLARVEAAVRQISASHHRTQVEVKPASVALHTRRAARPVALAAADDVLTGPATWPGLQVFHGKEVVELSISAATKGTAVRAIRERLRIAPGGVLYLGDDTTDERAFAVLDQAGGDLAIKVGDGETLAARRVADPEAVARLLTRLADLRSGER